MDFANIDKSKHAIVNYLGLKWIKNISKTFGAQDYGLPTINNEEKEQSEIVPMISIKAENPNHQASLWTKVNDQELLKLLQSNHGIYEIIQSHVKRKVFFDIDGKEEIDLNVLKSIILDKFPNANMQISGSILPKKGIANWSYHIILSNYYFKNLNDMAPFRTWTSDIKYVDSGIYTSNRNFKCINQSKSNETRIQQYIEGSSMLTKHCVLVDFDEDSIDASTLEWEFHDVDHLEKQHTTIDLSSIVGFQLEIPKDFNWYTTLYPQILLMIPNKPRSHEHSLHHTITWVIMLWAYHSDISLEQFLKWVSQKDNDLKRLQKYEYYWDKAKDSFNPGDNFIKNLLIRFYPKLFEYDRNCVNFIDNCNVETNIYI